MTTISFNDDSSDVSKHSIKISIRKENLPSPPDSLTGGDESAMLQTIETYIKAINEVNDNIIVKYDYNITKNDEFELCILFKHLFKKFDEPQRYIYVKCYHLPEKHCLLFGDMDTSRFPFPIPTMASKIPIKSGMIHYLSQTPETTFDLLIKYTTSIIHDSANKTMIQNFITTALMHSIDYLNQQQVSLL